PEPLRVLARIGVAADALELVPLIRRAHRDDPRAQGHVVAACKESRVVDDARIGRGAGRAQVVLPRGEYADRSRGDRVLDRQLELAVVRPVPRVHDYARTEIRCGFDREGGGASEHLPAAASGYTSARCESHRRYSRVP